MNPAEGEVQQHTGRMPYTGLVTAYLQSNNFITSGSSVFSLDSSENSQHLLPVRRVAGVYRVRSFHTFAILIFCNTSCFALQIETNSHMMHTKVKKMAFSKYQILICMHH